MADSLEMLNEKFWIAVRSFSPPSGIIDFDNLSLSLTGHIVGSTNLNDMDATMRCLYGIEKVLYLKFAEQGRDISWTAIDELVESFRWFLLKDPRRFMKTWEYKMSAIFDIIDQDGDGFVNQEEFNIYYQLGHRKDDEFLTRAFRIIDTEKLGKLTKQQYTEAYMNYFSDPDISYDQLPLF